MTRIIINDQNYREHLRPVINGQKVRGGHLERDWSAHPYGSYYFAKPFDIPLIPEVEWAERLEERKRKKKQLVEVRNRGMFGKQMPSRDQNGRGYCWAHSSVSAMLLCRAMDNLPYVDLSAYAVACIIKNYRDQGGWCMQSLEWMVENGCPDSKFWPQQAVDRKLDTPEMRANAKLHRFTKWVELEPGNVEQMVTLLLMGIPVVTDFNWWSHSVCTMQLESVKPLRTRIWNSWGDKWSEDGTGELEERKATPDGAVAPWIVTAA